MECDSNSGKCRPIDLLGCLILVYCLCKILYVFSPFSVWLFSVFLIMLLKKHASGVTVYIRLVL